VHCSPDKVKRDKQSKDKHNLNPASSGRSGQLEKRPQHGLDDHTEKRKTAFHHLFGKKNSHALPAAKNMVKRLNPAIIADPFLALVAGMCGNHIRMVDAVMDSP